MRRIKIPALIDPHVHFRTPGAEHKEDWKTAAKACWQGGITTVFDMPNNTPVCTTLERVLEKKSLIAKQLQEVGIPIRTHLYLGASKESIKEIERAADHVIGIKVFMGSSTGSLLMEDQESLETVFQIAAGLGKVVAVHAEDEAFLRERWSLFADRNDPALHSQWRSPEAAAKAVLRAIELSAKYGTKLYILHMSSRAELSLLRQAKKTGVPVFGEATPNHLFLDLDDYARIGNYAVVNPPLRSKEDQEALWEAIVDGTIDTLGTDHAPHTHEEKSRPYGKAPSGIPGVDTLLPLMLDSVNKERISLDRVIELTRTNIERIFNLPHQEDAVWIDLDEEREVRLEELHTKVGWSPYVGRILKGWPIQVEVQEKAPSYLYQPRKREEVYLNG